MKWIVRGGGEPLDRRIDPEPATARSGRELEEEHVLQSAYGEVVFRYDRDLAIGRAKLVVPGTRLVSRRVAFPLDVIDWLAWAMSEIDFHEWMRAMARLDAPSLDATERLVQHVLRAVEGPWPLS